MQHPYIIAEAGNNHNGDVPTGMELIDVAANAGATSVKFQIIYPEELYLTSFYENGQYRENEVIAMRRKSMLSEEQYLELAAYAKERDMSVSASVFGPKALDLLKRFQPDYIKIASCDLNNLRLLRETAQTGIKIILSTGMSTLKEIELAVMELEKIGFRNLVLMHCVSVYPVELASTNVYFIKTLQKNFNYPVGFSDHSHTNAASLLALALGAEYFEKHFTLDKSQTGFDHSYALEPDELEHYINELLDGFQAITPQQDKLSAEEREVMQRARRSLYASRDLNTGHTLTDEDILVVRPQGPLEAHQIDQVIGKVLTSSIKKHQALTRDIIS